IHREAAEHFHEALRINPNLDLAQRGLIESLKCRFPLNRLFHLFRPDRHLTFWTTLIWLFFFPILIPLMALSLLLRPMSGLILLIDPNARRFMKRDQVIESILSGGATIMALGCLVGFFAWSDQHDLPRAQILLAGSSWFATAVLTILAFRSRRIW